ncbi:DNA polymerase IV [Angustibacter sp. McL0619]|uniref:DNA polymerase IV n=1 Tax=Angustibacter sp. McL0619 TaxID=3415676 RepID=UPI003CFA1D5C
MTRWVLHVDLDQFLAAVEVLRHPELAGLPVVVGGDGDPTKRGVVSTASYEARALGVGSGTPLRTAARRIPDAVFLPVDRPHYEPISEQVMATLREVTDEVEVLGWDEAFLGVDDPPDDDPEAVAREVQRRVLAATGLHCSVGIGRNRLQAKTATSYGKPAGVFRITGATWFDLLGDLPPDALWGIGSKTSRKLSELDITTVRTLAETDEDALAARFGPTTGPWLRRLAAGRDSATIRSTPRERRSLGREVTFQQDLHDWDDVRAQVVELANRVAAEVAESGVDAVRVVIKLRFVPFTTRTSSRVLPAPTTAAAAIEQAALEAFDRFAPRAVRLVGVRAELIRT